MKEKVIEAVLAALGYAMGIIFMGGAILLCWELFCLLFTFIIQLVS